MKERRAHAVLFGFDFQVNAAIVLMLENMDELQTVRLEGNFEDIELELCNNEYILAQAKAVEDSSDVRNVRKNFSKALTTLSEGATKADVRQLVFITNSPDPFNDKDSKYAFWGHTRKRYSELPPSARDIVDKAIATVKDPLDLSKLMIQVLPFETDNDVERHKVIIDEVKDFIGALNLSEGLGKKVYDVWFYDVFQNGTKKNDQIRLSKKDIIWPIIVIETDIEKCDSDFLEEIDEAVYEEVTNRYRDTINNSCERFDLYMSILYDFNSFNGNKNQKTKCREFATQFCEKYKKQFITPDMDNETLEALTKIVLYNVVQKRIRINKIKKGANL